MKKSTISSVFVAIILGSATVFAHASSYDPTAANRYSATFPATSHATATNDTAYPVGSEAQGFRPFAADRYTSSSHTADKAKPDQAVMADRKGTTFNPFAANRYTR